MRVELYRENIRIIKQKSPLRTFSKKIDSIINIQKKVITVPFSPIIIDTAYIEIQKILINHIKTTIRSHYSPKHVPDDIFQVDDIPLTNNGKRMEKIIKQLFEGKDIQQINVSSVANPG